MQLARDSHSVGDTVMTESYLQHAEHYYRIIAAAQNAQQAAYNQANGLPNPLAEDATDDEDEFEVAGADRFTFRAPQAFQQNGGFNQPNYQPGQGQAFGELPGNGDQPPIPEGAMGEGGQQQLQPRPPRQERPFANRRPFDNRGDRGDNPNRDRNHRRFGRDRPFGERPYGDRANGEPRMQDGNSPSDRVPEEHAPDFARDERVGLPSFITAPVRSMGPEESEAPLVADLEVGGDGPGRLRSRRRRRPRIDGAPETGGDDQG